MRVENALKHKHCKYSDKHHTNELKAFLFLCFIDRNNTNNHQSFPRKTSNVFHDRSSALVQLGTERTEVMNQVGVDLISQDVTEARWAVTT